MLPSHPRLQTSYRPSAHLVSSPSALLSLCHVSDCFPKSPASSFFPPSFRVLQWNAGDLQARSAKLLHFISLYYVDLISTQKSNLNSSSSYRITKYSPLRSDRTHWRSGIFSPDDPHASGSVIILVRQSLFVFELLKSSISLLDRNSDYVGINISLNNSSLLS